MQAVAVGFVRCDGGGSVQADVAVVGFFGIGIIAPGEFGIWKTAPGGGFPFGFGGESFAGPDTVGFGIVKGNAYDGM